MGHCSRLKNSKKNGRELIQKFERHILVEIKIIVIHLKASQVLLKLFSPFMLEYLINVWSNVPMSKSKSALPQVEIPSMKVMFTEIRCLKQLDTQVMRTFALIYIFVESTNNR